jgi:hypothetical protein
MTNENMLKIMEFLKANLGPSWVFQKFGNDGAIACYPPSHIGANSETYNELNNFAVISSVGNCFYVITSLK